MMTLTTRFLLSVLLMATVASAFTSVSISSNSPTITTTRLLSESWDGAGSSGTNNGNKNVGAIEQIEFKIFPDGRVEETVRGVKGGSCHKVTEKINELLGKVVDSAPTEEMYEQEVVMDQTLTNTQGDGDGSSWEGGSQW